jgi:hypothetical protein
LEAKIARNFARSNNGIEVSAASANTRLLKSSQLSSRLRYRSGGSAFSTGAVVAAGGTAGERGPRSLSTVRDSVSASVMRSSSLIAAALWRAAPE